MWQWYEIRAYRQLHNVGLSYEQVGGREFEAAMHLTLCEQQWQALNTEKRKRTAEQGAAGSDDEELERLVRLGVKRRNEEHEHGKRC